MKLSAARNSSRTRTRKPDSILLQCSLIVAVAAFTFSAVEATPVQVQDSNLDRWLDRQIPTDNDRVIPVDNDDQGENEYMDAVLLREGFINGQVEPKKKPMQARFPFFDGIRNRRRQLMNDIDDDRFYAKRDLNGMSMSITHNLDILRRGLLRELSLRQREQDRRQIMENNKKFLNGIGRRRK